MRHLKGSEAPEDAGGAAPREEPTRHPCMGVDLTAQALVAAVRRRGAVLVLLCRLQQPILSRQHRHIASLGPMSRQLVFAGASMAEWEKLVNSRSTYSRRGLLASLCTSMKATILTPESFLTGARPGTALNVRLMKELQNTVRPDIFNLPAAYDGDKKLYTLVELDFDDTGGTFIVVVDTMAYTIRLTRTRGIIDTSVLLRFAQGVHQDASVTTTNQALNVVLRMAPLSNPALIAAKQRRIFYASHDVKALSLGIVLWRGYFSTLRPGIDRLFTNIDVSTGAMYRPGSLITLACEYLQQENVHGLITLLHSSEPDRVRLALFITGLRVEWRRSGSHQNVVSRTVRGLSASGADSEMFKRRDGGQISTAAHFRQMENRSLQYEHLHCVLVGNVDAGRGALVPIEMCTVMPGQPLRVAIPQELVYERNQWSSRPPSQRLQDVKKGLTVLGYEESDYARRFGIEIKPSVHSVSARVLPPPTLKYVSASNPREESFAFPHNGFWNMWDQHFYKCAKLESWALVSYEPLERFTRDIASAVINGFVKGCLDAGIVVVRKTPSALVYLKDQGDVSKQLDDVEKQCTRRNGRPPSLFLVMKPDRDNHIYIGVKHWGDVKRGIATQCLTLRYCLRTDPDHEIWPNVAHKINMKLGGINVVVHPAVLAVGESPSLLGVTTDATMIMGAFMHPWHSGVVASLDAHGSKYAARSRLQKAGNEIIEALDVMTASLLAAHMRYRRENEGGSEHEIPQRLIFFRDGVPEDQFQEILDQELTQLKKACSWLNVHPKITFLVVAKRHHIRFFDDEHNCGSGTIVDREIVHPTDSDFYLQGHGQFSERGTTRAAHYSVLYDENNLSADQVQILSFALCHLYGRSSSAVSIPAPVYYADRVCARMANHIDPDTSVGRRNMPNLASPSQFDDFVRAFRPPHENQKDEMYFI
ncbi:argonaute-like protein [Mycena alexandri]|uniref:Argonaute-like protein n=1 Tax=Mycena alexandri TaxID=1745969 RepID=A0AAD6WX63_9AGAR|nr:argonaute-like protein [Mycena alexandri]